MEIEKRMCYNRNYEYYFCEIETERMNSYGEEKY